MGAIFAFLTMQKIAPTSGRKLTLLPLAAATYFMVSGGAYGLEELVQTSGYGMALGILLLTPLLWSLPTGLMVGELSAAIPAEGGFYVWVRRAMGPFWGFQEAWLSLMASVFDMAIYPTLFVTYLGRVWPPATAGNRGVLLAAAVIMAALVWNLYGSRAVGNGSILLGILLLSPFALITLYALFRQVTPGPHETFTLNRSDVFTGILVAMWNYMGWDNASTVAGEVENPQKTYPRVMMLTLLAIILSYMVPIAAVWRTNIQPSAWGTGSWFNIASMVAAPWLGSALVLAAMVSTFGSLNSLVMSYSRLPLAMAEDGLLPQMFRRKLQNGAPWVSLVVLAACWTASLGLNFDKLIMLDILLYGVSLVLEFVALAVLRIREPQLERPFRIPGGLPSAILVGVAPAALLFIAFLKNRDARVGNVSALTVALALMTAGVVCYFVSVWLWKPKIATENV